MAAISISLVQSTISINIVSHALRAPKDGPKGTFAATTYFEIVEANPFTQEEELAVLKAMPLLF
jgi:hypothetical protein